MKIEISEKGSEAFYREVVNISAQYRSILKRSQYLYDSRGIDRVAYGHKACFRRRTWL